MGVSGLTQFIQNRDEVRGGVLYIDIIEEIRKYKKFVNKDPVIIFDYSPLQHVKGFSEGTGMELLCGLRWKSIVEKITHLIQAMIDEGAQIVFFLEAPVQMEQEDSWLKRKTNQFQEYCNVVDKIKAKNFYLTHNQRTSPVIVGAYLKQELQKFGKWIKIFETDVDLAIAQYAKETNALAIFTDDSDFLIFEGFYRMWKIREINFDTLTTKEFSRTKLRGTLKLRFYHMPLFSTLCGNDVLPRCKLMSFHNACDGTSKFRWIADFVRQHPPIHEITRTDIETIGQLVGCSADDICLSLRQYDLRYKPQQHVERDPFLRKLQNFQNDLPYIILKGFPTRIGPMYEDVHQDAFKRTQTQMTLELYRCTMGILLQHKKVDKTIKQPRPVYLIKNYELGYEKFHMEPIYPQKIKVPPLKELIFRQKDANLDKTRLQLLQWAIKCPKLNIDELVLLEPVFVPIVLTLCYLVKEAGWSVEGADMFLLCYFDAIYDVIPDDIKLPTVDTFHFRTFQACFMYLQVQTGIIELLACLGLQKFAVYSPFDGVYFHHLCNLWTNLNDQQKEEFLCDVQKMRLYKNI